MKSIKTPDLKEMLSWQTFSVTVGLLAGLILATAQGEILRVPGIFILIPGFLAMRSLISASLASRITIDLFSQKIDPNFATAKHSSRVISNLVASFALVLIASTFLGLFAYLGSWYFFGEKFPLIIVISIVGGILSNLFEIPIAIAGSIWFYNKGKDPAEAMGHTLSTTGDITSILALLFTVAVLA